MKFWDISETLWNIVVLWGAEPFWLERKKGMSVNSGIKNIILHFYGQISDYDDILMTTVPLPICQWTHRCKFSH